MIDLYASRKNCFEFNPVDYKIQQVKSTNERRYDTVCTVFEGKVVVSSGYSQTVEMYDHIADIWSYIINMIKQITGSIYFL